MTALLHTSWRRAWAALAVQPRDGLFEQLIDCYREPHRRYHTLEHLQTCLHQLQPVLDQAKHSGEVELALWFHDAVYRFDRQDNEWQSSQWALRELATAGVNADVGERVHALVMATQHAALPATADERLLVDIDLSILGEKPGIFDGYEHQIREEYAWVAEALFRQKRASLLRGFLARTFIFSTVHFRQRLEQQARANLQRSIARLDNPIQADLR
jgi:predicted metal-dependent HD superfamily phosphohydrolase